ncbi:uncharacterized protein [Ptychodera flava]|uniref:uncharacterized protein n=1 Tax=Ptychodera flava TaxID=63121 RepID=UPI003969BDCC
MAAAIDKLKDKQLMIEAFEKYKSLLHSDAYQQLSDEMLDPKNPNVIANMAEIQRRATTEVLQMYGIDQTDIPTKLPLDELVLEYFPDDLEVVDCYKNFYQKPMRGLDKNGPPVKSGDIMPDVKLVSMETREMVSLQDLHIHKDRPLCIIASSIS